MPEKAPDGDFKVVFKHEYGGHVLVADLNQPGNKSVPHVKTLDFKHIQPKQCSKPDTTFQSVYIK
ncbi:hypothetical protein GCM10007423_32820 [Dyadobacter endophyticus]|uniref:Uncharacterized protein n=1 Tax=Dyadobacter endophyticus TaxID=1749036 RepID=A0ABQ1YUZ5_9BACT|nr:hypothetical protein GCM10007423_32820 [Dyadobacter endophyticus]